MVRGLRRLSATFLPAALLAVALLATAGLVVGCDSGSDGNDGAGQDVAGGGGEDVDQVGPGACGEMATPAGWAYSAGPYGDQEGETFEPHTFSSCSGEDVDMGQVIGSAKATLITVGAGWCVACQEEADSLEDDVYGKFCPDGLHVIQLLIEDAEGLPATQSFCENWRDYYGLSFPVLVDPLSEVAGSDVELPLNLLLDANGVIRMRTVGEPPADLEQRIEALLAE